MKILETTVFRGPNIYALFPVIRHVVDLGVLEDWPSAKLGGFVDGLLEALPEAPAGQRLELCRLYLARAARALTQGERDAIAGEVMAARESSDFAPFLGPDSMAGVPLSVAAGARVIAAPVAPLAVTAAAVRAAQSPPHPPPPR